MRYVLAAGEEGKLVEEARTQCVSSEVLCDGRASAGNVPILCRNAAAIALVVGNLSQ